MSIETTLTWAVALGVLAGALIIRTLALGIYRLALFVWVRFGGAAPARREVDVREALPAIPLRQHLASAGEGIGAALIFVAATVAHWIELLGRGLGWALDRIARGSVAAWRWSEPHARTAAHALGRGLRATWVWLAATVSTLARDLRSTSHPGSAKRAPLGASKTPAGPPVPLPSSRVAAARVARARSSSGTRAGAA